MNLTRRAGLNFVAGLLRQGSRAIVAIAVLRLVIRSLGPELYGAWVVIQQTTGYLSLADLRAMGTLKLTLARRQHVSNDDEKRRQVGAALVMWLVTLPILLVLGGLAVWLLPHLVETSRPGEVRIAMAIAVAAIAIDRVTSIPSQVLRGVNLDYKSMGLDAAAILVSGAITAGAVKTGLGLPALAGANLVGLLLFNGIRFVVMKRTVPWFGVLRPTSAETRRFASLSGWLLLGEFAALILNSADILLSGVLIGPAAAAGYFTTQAALRIAMWPLTEVLSSSGAGLAGLCGQHAWGRVAQVRIEQHCLGIGLIAIVGTVVAGLNEDLLRLWVDEGYYAGDAVNLIFVFVTLASIITTTDILVADAVLASRSRAAAMFVAGVAVVAISVPLAHIYGLKGLAACVLIARLIVLMWLPGAIRRATNRHLDVRLRRLARPLAVGIVLILLANLSPINAEGWLELSIAALVLGGVSGSVWWFLGLGRVDRRCLVSRVRNLFQRVPSADAPGPRVG